MEVTKSEVEELLGCEVDEKLFRDALTYAKKKQQYSYEREKRPVILQHWYLVKLTEECVRALAFSKFTMDLCETLNNIEKEHLVNDRSTPVSTYIVPQQTALNQ